LEIKKDRAVVLERKDEVTVGLEMKRSELSGKR